MSLVDQFPEGINGVTGQVQYEIVARDTETGEEICSGEYLSVESLQEGLRKIEHQVEVYQRNLFEEVLEHDYED